MLSDSGSLPDSLCILQQMSVENSSGPTHKLKMILVFNHCLWVTDTFAESED